MKFYREKNSDTLGKDGPVYREHEIRKRNIKGSLEEVQGEQNIEYNLMEMETHLSSMRENIRWLTIVVIGQALIAIGVAFYYISATPY